MLILSRKESEQVCLGNDIVLTIVRVSNDKVRVGVTAPSDVKVLRGELQSQTIEIKIHRPEEIPIAPNETVKGESVQRRAGDVDTMRHNSRRAA